MVSELLRGENLFLIIIGLVWVIGAVMQDFKRREIDNLWNFSLIFIILGYRAFVSVFNWDYWFFLNGLIGLGIFFVLGNVFYYSRIFAGGDAKLLMALGVVLPLSYDWILNTKIFVIFILLSFILGSVYTLVYSFVLVVLNWNGFSKEFVKQSKFYKKMFFISLVFFILWVVVMVLFENLIFILIGFIVLLFPVLFIFAKSVEESCMVRLVDVKKVTIGDWLYKDVLIKGKKIKANWNGISPFELKKIQKNKKKVLIKYGIPFAVSFLFGFIGLLWLIWSGFIFRIGI